MFTLYKLIRNMMQRIVIESIMAHLKTLSFNDKLKPRAFCSENIHSQMSSFLTNMKYLHNL